MTSPSSGPERIQEVMYGFWASRALFAGVELGIFDELAKGPASAEVLAYRLRLHPAALERLLNALVSLALLRKENNRYVNTQEAGEYLVKESPTYIGAQMEHLSNLHWRLWQFLPDAIRENTPRIKQVFGLSVDMFGAMYQSPQELRSFIQGMHSLTMTAAQEVVTAFDLSSYHTFMDVGGGSGALCIAAVKQYPHLKGVVLELPAVCPIAEEFVRQNGVSDRVQVKPGNFFDRGSIPTEADVIGLGWVLHDWLPPKGQEILGNCYSALKKGGVVMMCEKLLDENRTGPLFTTLMNLHMLVSTGGQEHTASEYGKWMEEAGFRDMEVKRLKGNRDLIVGHKR